MSLDNNSSYAAPEDWRAYSGVLSRRVFAFIVDYLFIGLLWIPAAVIVFFPRHPDTRARLVLYTILFFVVAGLYFGMSLAGLRRQTPGMRMMGIAMVRLDGRKLDFVTAIAHLALFWILNSVLTPLILLAGLFIERSRLVHDLLVGTATVRTY